jgi:hypothetical protein
LEGVRLVGRYKGLVFFSLALIATYQTTFDSLLEGVKQRLASASVSQRVAAVKEALKYGQAGLDLVIHILEDESPLLQQSA